MSFNPLKEKGLPIEKQTRSWFQLDIVPYDKERVDPYSRTSGILMNGIETEGILFSHNFLRQCDDIDIRKKLALTRRIEQEQQKVINWMIPYNESHLEVTIAYEQVAVDLTAFLAANEPNEYVKAALDFALLEDFDHLYRFANLLKVDEDKEAAKITKKYTEITIGRPTIVEHRHPFDDVRKFTDFSKADPLTKLHTLIITAAEQQTMNFYMNIGNRHRSMLGRNLFQEIAQIEEQHVTHYGSLIDPHLSWFENLLLHEYTECYLYYSLMLEETDPAVKKIWEVHLDMEIEHLHLAADMIRKYEKKDPEELLPTQFPSLFKFESNIDYVRNVLANQFYLNAMDTEFVPVSSVPKDYRYYPYQRKINENSAPSELVIEKIIEREGKDYRQELAGPHPIEDYREE